MISARTRDYVPVLTGVKRISRVVVVRVNQIQPRIARIIETAEAAALPSGHDSIVVFSVGPGGALTFVEHESTRGQTPRNFALDPSGRWLIAANQQSGTSAVFSIDQTTGALSPVGSLTRAGSPVSILFM